MVVIEEITDLMKSSIDDIILTGASDVTENIVQFLPDFTTLYLKLGAKYIVFESVEQYSKLKITLSDSICYHKINDQDFKCSFISLVELLLVNGTYSSTKVKKILLYNGKIEGENINSDIAKIELTNNQAFFIDPSNFWGLTISGDMFIENTHTLNGKYIDLIDNGSIITIHSV